MTSAYDADVADHEWFVDEREYRRHEQRRGRRHAYKHLDPRRTAFVVVDVVPSPTCSPGEASTHSW